MAVTEESTSKVLRGVAFEAFDGHAFTSVSDLPRMAAGRPAETGNPALDAIRHAAWEEGLAQGQIAGAAEGYNDGLEEGRVEGRAIGHREGMATAQAEAFAQMQAAVEAALAALDHAATEFHQRDATALAEIEPMVVDLAISLAESILDREITVATDPGREALGRALALAPEHEQYIAYLNPADRERLGDVSDLAPGRAVQLVADASVGPGGCVVEAGAARIDARIETALDRVREVLRP